MCLSDIVLKILVFALRTLWSFKRSYVLRRYPVTNDSRLSGRVNPRNVQWWIQRGVRDAPPSPSFFIFMHFLMKIGQNIRLRPPPPLELASPLPVWWIVDPTLTDDPVNSHCFTACVRIAQIFTNYCIRKLHTLFGQKLTTFNLVLPKRKNVGLIWPESRCSYHLTAKGLWQ